MLYEYHAAESPIASSTSFDRLMLDCGEAIQLLESKSGEPAAPSRQNPQLQRSVLYMWPTPLLQLASDLVAQALRTEQGTRKAN